MSLRQSRHRAPYPQLSAFSCYRRLNCGRVAPKIVRRSAQLTSPLFHNEKGPGPSGDAKQPFDRLASHNNCSTIALEASLIKLALLRPVGALGSRSLPMSGRYVWRCSKCSEINSWSKSVCQGCSKKFADERKLSECSACGHTNPWETWKCKECKEPL
jgi:hypothetical protein